MGRTFKFCRYCAALGESCRNFQYITRNIPTGLLRTALQMEHGAAYLRLRTGLDVDLTQLTVMPPSIYYPFEFRTTDFPVYERVRVLHEEAHTCWVKDRWCNCEHEVTPWFAFKQHNICRNYRNKRSSKRTKKWKASTKQKSMKKQFYNYKKFSLEMLDWSAAR